MKHSSLIAAGVVALVSAAMPAGAQDLAAITQAGSAGNTGTIEQFYSGGNNVVTIDQVGGENGGGNVARVWQSDTADAEVRVAQSGSMNGVIVQQFGGRGLRASVDIGMMQFGESGGTGNGVWVQQSGFDLAADVRVVHGSGNRADVTQRDGERNQAGVDQYNSVGNVASLYQAGTDLQAGIRQAGGGNNIALIAQTR